MENLHNKKAIITGGGRGLGKATALALAAEGVSVGITGRNEENLKQTVKELEAFGIQAVYAVFDVADAGQVKSEVSKLIETLGGVDILINNAGIAEFGSFLDMDALRWQEILMTNVMGIYHVTKEVLPHLVAKNQGDIVNVSSTAGLTGNANTSAYSASKFAVIGMSESLMKEVRKHNIRVCTLTPSTIASDMSVDLGLTDGNPDSVLQPSDFAELIIANLKLPRRALLKSASLWSTNP
ncbi:3-ketoacyl-ACP reductase [Sphingobacterium spiritivorum]|uniref:3-ketoacyl-ACP reductase n=1 Tax=Sphingobacterium spiritivorum TaxID=258 RepID=UPI00191A743E|nr:3-ketoacyl-ACP reductase [Sphingobacterium spiritivorum]QQT26138.1 3-ketoacyl-ACP reductase [Sphingobacterium spiritivorum]